MYFRTQEIECRDKNIVRGGDRVGIYFLESGAVARPSKVIYDRAHSAIAEVEKGMFDWEEILRDACWFHWTGITPAISQGAADVCLEAIQTANDMGITVSCDLNYRKNFGNTEKSIRNHAHFGSRMRYYFG